MVAIKTKEEFLNAVVTMLAARPDANVLVIIDSDVGLEMIQTRESFIWSFGVLAASEKLLDEKFRALMDAEQNRKMEARADAEMETALRDTGKAN